MKFIKIFVIYLPYVNIVALFRKVVVVMKRRDFICMTALLSLNLEASEYRDEILIVNAVLKHMFKNSQIVPSYSSKDMVSFILETISHPSYDREIRDFILQGARALDKMVKGFSRLNSFQKEIYLREFENDSFAQSWLYQVQILGFEAIYSSPIYGVNRDKRYYKYVDAKSGNPLPKSRYINL